MNHIRRTSGGATGRWAVVLAAALVSTLAVTEVSGAQGAGAAEPVGLAAPASTTADVVTTIAGTGAAGFNGDNVPALSAQMNGPSGIAHDSHGDVYFADEGNNLIRKISAATGNVITVAGTGTLGYNGDNRSATTAQLAGARDLAIDSHDNVYVADFYNNRIRKVDTAGTISTIAGTGVFGYNGDSRAATTAQLEYPSGIAIDPTGNIYFTQYWDSRVRKIDTSGTITTVAGAPATPNFNDGIAATSASLSWPMDVVFDSAGNIVVSDLGTERVRRIDTTGVITTVAGLPDKTYYNGGYNGDNQPATKAELNHPYGIAIDGTGNLLIADLDNQRIRQVDAAGVITTIAGTGASGFNGDGLPATSTQLNFASQIGFDAAGHLLISDLLNERIRMVAPGTTGSITGVLHGPGGEAAAGVHVVVYSATGWWVTVGSTTTAADGTYQLGGLPPAAYRLRVTDFQGRYRNGWASGRLTQPTGDAYTVPSGGSVAVDLTLAARPVGKIVGTVTAGPDAAPKANVELQLFDGLDPSHGYVMSGKTDSFGHIHLTHVPDGAYYLRIIDRDHMYAPIWFHGVAPPLNRVGTAPVGVSGGTPSLIGIHLT